MGRGCEHAKRFFFGLGVRWPKNLAILGTFLPAAQELDGFPMTWKRNNPLFVRKSAFHILYRSFPELPHHGIILQSSKHDLLYSIVAVFQWPEREKHSICEKICISQIWSNIFWLILSPPWYYIAKFQIWSIICNCYQVTFLTSSPRKFEKWSYSCYMSLIKTIHVITTLHCTGPMLIDFTNCSWPIWRSTEEYICINYA